MFVNSFYENLTIPHVSLDDEKAGYLATKHLLECGHTRIAGIFKADDGQGRADMQVHKGTHGAFT